MMAALILAKFHPNFYTLQMFFQFFCLFLSKNSFFLDFLRKTARLKSDGFSHRFYK